MRERRGSVGWLESKLHVTPPSRLGAHRYVAFLVRGGRSLHVGACLPPIWFMITTTFRLHEV